MRTEGTASVHCLGPSRDCFEVPIVMVEIRIIKITVIITVFILLPIENMIFEELNMTKNAPNFAHTSIEPGKYI